MYNYNEEFNYFDDNELAADWYNRLCERLNWKLFDKQEDIVYMANETETGIPRFKEGAIDKMEEIIHNQMSFFYYCLIIGFIKHVRVKSNVDLCEEMIWMLQDDMGEEEYEEWEKNARHDIFNEYADHLGVEKAKELAKQWWGEDYDPE